MGTLQGFRLDVQFVALVMLTLKRNLLFRPRLQGDLQVLLEPPPALRIGRVKSVVVVWKRAPADAEVDPALADVVQRGNFFGHPHRVAEGQQQHAKSYSGALGAGRHRRGYRDGRRQHAERRKVVLRQPDGVHPHAFRLVHQLEAAGKGFLVRRPFRCRKFDE